MFDSSHSYVGGGRGGGVVMGLPIQYHEKAFRKIYKKELEQEGRGSQLKRGKRFDGKREKVRSDISRK